MDRQFGAVPGGGTSSLSVAVNLLFESARVSKRSHGILFADLHESVLPEVALSRLLADDDRAASLRHLGYPEDEISQFVATYVEGVPVLRHSGVGAALRSRTGTNVVTSASQASLVEAFLVQVGGPEIRWQISCSALPLSPSCSSFGRASRQPGWWYLRPATVVASSRARALCGRFLCCRRRPWATL